MTTATCADSGESKEGKQVIYATTADAEMTLNQQEN